jgi:hypothetical protein
MTWACPHCRSQSLRVNVQINTNAMLIQTGDGNFETDDDRGGDHEWDGNSQMTCCDCGFVGTAAGFRVPDDYLALRALAEQLARTNYDGEEINPGHGKIEEFDMSGDDAAGTLSSLIREAREILGES